jgi:hypothetical protein
MTWRRQGQLEYENALASLGASAGPMASQALRPRDRVLSWILFAACMGIETLMLVKAIWQVSR